MSMNSGAFPRIDSRPTPRTQLAQPGRDVLAVGRHGYESVVAWVEAVRRRRAARRAARAEELRMEWWRSQ